MGIGHPPYLSRPGDGGSSADLLGFFEDAICHGAVEYSF